MFLDLVADARTETGCSESRHDVDTFENPFGASKAELDGMSSAAVMRYVRTENIV